MVELSSEHKALIEVLPACKPQASSCKAFISEESTSNKDASRRASAEGENVRWSSSPSHIHLSQGVQVAKLGCTCSMSECTASFYLDYTQSAAMLFQGSGCFSSSTNFFLMFLEK